MISSKQRVYSLADSENACRWCLQGNVTISNDGATIMKLLDVVHPAAKTLVDVSLSQDAEVSRTCISRGYIRQWQSLLRQHARATLLHVHEQLWMAMFVG